MVVLVLVALFVVLPLVEIYVLAQVAGAIGLGWALIALLAVSALGGWIVKRQGLGVWRRAQQQLNARQMPTTELTDGVALLLTGALLVVPGFVTDAFGALLLVPALRRWAARRIRERWSSRRTVTATYRGRIIDVRADDDDGAPGSSVPGAVSHPKQLNRP